MDAVTAVGAEQGYVYVLDESSNVILVRPSGHDLLPAAKLRLGI